MSYAELKERLKIMQVQHERRGGTALGTAEGLTDIIAQERGVKAREAVGKEGRGFGRHGLMWVIITLTWPVELKKHCAAWPKES